MGGLKEAVFALLLLLGLLLESLLVVSLQYWVELSLFLLDLPRVHDFLLVYLRVSPKWLFSALLLLIIV